LYICNSTHTIYAYVWKHARAESAAGNDNWYIWKLIDNYVFSIRLESSTQVSKKRHSGRQVHRQLSTTTSISESTKAGQQTDDMPLEFSTSTAFSIEASKYVGHVYRDSIQEISTVQPEMNTQNLSNRRRRRHHHKR